MWPLSLMPSSWLNVGSLALSSVLKLKAAGWLASELKLDTFAWPALLAPAVAARAKPPAASAPDATAAAATRSLSRLALLIGSPSCAVRRAEPGGLPGHSPRYARKALRRHGGNYRGYGGNAGMPRGRGRRPLPPGGDAAAEPEAQRYRVRRAGRERAPAVHDPADPARVADPHLDG